MFAYFKAPVQVVHLNKEIVIEVFRQDCDVLILYEQSIQIVKIEIDYYVLK